MDNSFRTYWTAAFKTVISFIFFFSEQYNKHFPRAFSKSSFNRIDMKITQVAGNILESVKCTFKGYLCDTKGLTPCNLTISYFTLPKWNMHEHFDFQQNTKHFK